MAERDEITINQSADSMGQFPLTTNERACSRKHIQSRSEEKLAARQLGARVPPLTNLHTRSIPDSLHFPPTFWIQQFRPSHLPVTRDRRYKCCQRTISRKLASICNHISAINRRGGGRGEQHRGEEIEIETERLLGLIPILFFVLVCTQSKKGTKDFIFHSAKSNRFILSEKKLICTHIKFRTSSNFYTLEQ